MVPVPPVKVPLVGRSLKSCSTCVGIGELPAGVATNVAVTFLSLSIVTTHVLVPVHAPDQPLKFESDDAVAVNVT